MMDLTAAIVIMVSISVLAFTLGLQTGNDSRRRRILAQIISVMLMVGYCMFLWNRPVLTRLLPGSDLVIVGNWLPLWGSFFLGFCLASRSIPRWRKTALFFPAVAFCFYSIVAPVLGQPPRCEAAVGGKLLQHQTTPYTCSAACAASLLRLHNIAATEEELARLSLTREGTHWMGLYRGLNMKVQGTGWQVVVEPFDPGRLDQLPFSPSILALRMDVSQFEEGVDHGFRDDCGHSVVYLGRPAADRIAVFDPSPDFGIEEWDTQIMSCISDGVIMTLVPTDHAHPKSAAVTRNVAAVMLNRPLTAGL
ncbi:MAG: hypothetical protein Fues2KO_51090 [Fuerstiella sp.]